MAYNPTNWKNRIVDDEGNVLQEGTPLIAENMNKIEQELVELSELTPKVEANEQKLATHEQKISENKNSLDALIAEKGQPNGIATLGSDGIIHSSQLPSNLKEIKVAADLVERDALEKFEGLRVLVADASADATVGSGWAEYVWDGTAYIKTAEAEGIDLVVKWGNVTEKPLEFPPSKHTHTESDITDLDKYTKREVDDKLAGKSNVLHKHTESEITDLDKYSQQEVNDLLASKADKKELDNHANKTTLDKLTEGHLTQISNHENRLASLEESSGQLHTHVNKGALDKVTYSGSRPSIDLIAIEEQASRKYKYSEILETPNIPSKTSELANDSNFVQSNASKITVSATAPSNPQPNDIWIVI